MSTIRHDNSLADANQKLAAVRQQLQSSRRQRDDLKLKRDADPYDHRWPQAHSQAAAQVERLERAAAALEREIAASTPADQRKGTLNSGQVFISESSNPRYDI
jgi:hypothetical protein